MQNFSSGDSQEDMAKLKKHTLPPVRSPMCLSAAALNSGSSSSTFQSHAIATPLSGPNQDLTGQGM